MEKTISQLEKELATAKSKELKRKWDEYFEKVKKFVIGLEGKTLIIAQGNIIIGNSAFSPQAWNQY